MTLYFTFKQAFEIQIYRSPKEGQLLLTRKALISFFEYFKEKVGENKNILVSLFWYPVQI